MRIRVDMTVFDDEDSVVTIISSDLATITKAPDRGNVERAVNRVARHFALVDGLWRPFPMPEVY